MSHFCKKIKMKKWQFWRSLLRTLCVCVWARHSGPDQSHGCVIMFQSISEEFPLKGRCGIGFDLSTSRLQRSRPVKASSSVTLMTSPRGCHESVCSWPALPRSVCVKLLAVCLHARLFFVFRKDPQSVYERGQERETTTTRRLPICWRSTSLSDKSSALVTELLTPADDSIYTMSGAGPEVVAV